MQALGGMEEPASDAKKLEEEEEEQQEEEVWMILVTGSLRASW